MVAIIRSLAANIFDFRSVVVAIMPGQHTQTTHRHQVKTHVQYYTPQQQEYGVTQAIWI